MTKTVKLTENYIKYIKGIVRKSAKILIGSGKKYPTHTGDMFCHIVGNTSLVVAGLAIRKNDILIDSTKLPLYKRNIDVNGIVFTDYTDIDHYVNVDCYILKDENDTCEMPDSVFNSLSGFVEEVT